MNKYYIVKKKTIGPKDPHMHNHWQRLPCAQITWIFFLLLTLLISFWTNLYYNRLYNETASNIPRASLAWQSKRMYFVIIKWCPQAVFLCVILNMEKLKDYKENDKEDERAGFCA